MRVIRTEMYFDLPDVGLNFSPLAKSVSVAWFKNEDSTEEQDVTELLRPIPNPDENKEQSLVNFIADCLLTGADGVKSEFIEGYLTGDEVAEAASMEVVIELSPPQLLALSTLVAKAPGIAIGTYIGMQIGIDHPTIMLASVPGGILAVSTAVGIARALEAGIHKKIEAIFDRTEIRSKSAAQKETRKILRPKEG